MDKVEEKKRQQEELCSLLATEGYDVMLLPIVLGSAGTFENCIASSTYTAYTLYRTVCTNGDTWKDKSQAQKQGAN